MSTNPTTQKKKAASRKRVFPAKEKCEAVLAVWSERRKPSEICREMDIPWQMLNNWQDLAMKGMMQALNPRRSTDGKPPALLSPRMEKLLEKADVSLTRRSRAEARLASIQKTVEAKKSGSSAGSPKG